MELAVCDQIGGLVYDAGVLDYFADARARLLLPGGTLVPGTFQLLAAPVASAQWPDTVGLWAQMPAGFDMGPMFERAVNTEFRFEIPASELLAEPRCWAEVDADHVAPITGRVELIIDEPGEVNGIAGMFRAALAPGVELTNCPGQPGYFKRWQNFYPLPEPVAVAPGDRVDVSFDIRPRSYLATWTVRVQRAGADRAAASRGSTVLGMFLTPTDLATPHDGAVARASSALAADRHALSLVDGQRTVADIVESTWSAHGAAFASRQDLKERIDALLRPHLHPEPTWPTSSTA
ncbi:MAG: hypothetical protein R2761_16990 [Acidimicrobiales bacterium]